MTLRIYLIDLFFRFSLIAKVLSSGRRRFRSDYGPAGKFLTRISALIIPDMSVLNTHRLYLCLNQTQGSRERFILHSLRNKIGVSALADHL